MNNLNREIRVGEELVLREDFMRDEFKPLHKRIFVVDGGFGRHTYTAGVKITGYYKIDGEHAYVDSSEVSPEETKAWQNARPLIVHSPNPGRYVELWKRIIQAERDGENITFDFDGQELFPYGPRDAKAECLKALHRRINHRGGWMPRGKKDSDDYFVNLLRDKRTIEDHYRSRIIIRSFNTPEVRKRLAHLITKYDE